MSNPDLDVTAPTRDARAREAGRRVGRFELVELLGSGGMGRVFLARDSTLARDVAIKIIRPDKREPEARGRIEREAQVMAQLSHPNLVTIYDAGISDGEFFIAMEYVPGTNLKHWLLDADRSWRDVVRMFLAAGRGLAAAHEAGVVHRDFKPANVLVSRRETVHVTDFGVAMVGDGSVPSSDSLQLTTTGAAIGTPVYMSPEQHLHEPVDARSDQFSFAVALTQALTGQSPFPGSTYEEISTRVTTGTPEISPRSMPRALEPVLLRGMARAPNDRYPSMSAMLDALEHAATERRSRWPLVVAAVTALAMAAAIVAIASRGGANAADTADAAPSHSVASSALPAATALMPDARVPVVFDAGIDAGVDAAVPAPTAKTRPKAKPKKKPINWRALRMVCLQNHERKSCVKCCKPEHMMKPYPDCGCYFDGDEWDREHGITR